MTDAPAKFLSMSDPVGGKTFIGLVDALIITMFKPATVAGNLTESAELAVAEVTTLNSLVSTNAEPIEVPVAEIPASTLCMKNPDADRLPPEIDVAPEMPPLSVSDVSVPSEVIVGCEEAETVPADVDVSAAVALATLLTFAPLMLTKFAPLP